MKELGAGEDDEAFAAALLQDMAVPLLAKEYPDVYEEMLTRRDDGAVRLSDIEREQFGWTHADAAAKMAASWNLPAELIEPIAQHGSEATILAESATGDAKGRGAIGPIAFGRR